ncbi:hypothetical protein Mapa_017589 [Marchantia paleacea]|nr:hypothetical protein Mapa_017589 [Marchantia paleacea]
MQFLLIWAEAGGIQNPAAEERSWIWEELRKIDPSGSPQKRSHSLHERIPARHGVSRRKPLPRQWTSSGGTSDTAISADLDRPIALLVL